MGNRRTGGKEEAPKGAKLAAAREEERARQNLRELTRAGKQTEADFQRLRDAQAALDDARRRS